LPVARQHEVRTTNITTGRFIGTVRFVAGVRASSAARLRIRRRGGASAAELKEPDSQLRSTLEVTGYRVQAADGEIGHVEDFLIEDQNWAIKSLVIATGHWWSGKNVLVSREIHRAGKLGGPEMVVNLTKAALLEEPEYEHAIPGRVTMTRGSSGINEFELFFAKYFESKRARWCLY